MDITVFKHINRIFIRNLALLLATGWFLSACAASSTLLNSDRIEQTFGNYGIDIIQSDTKRRTSSLFSRDNGTKTTRTYAVVDFSGAHRDAYAREQSLIDSGQSIGSTFRDAGWSISKQNLFIGEFEVPGDYKTITKLMRIRLPARLATHVYLFVVRKDGRSFTYATITEVHHPAYLDATDLKQIYGEIVFDDSNRDSLAAFIGPPNRSQ